MSEAEKDKLLWGYDGPRVVTRDGKPLGFSEVTSDALSISQAHNRIVHALTSERDRLREECDKLREELNWQNKRNSGYPTRGGFEFYVNEEWTGIAHAAIDTDTNFTASLMKKRFDPDDERVRIRRVIEDDALIAELATLRGLLERALPYVKNIANFRNDEDSKPAKLASEIESALEGKA